VSRNVATDSDRRSLYLVQSNPVPGREQEYGDWYTNRHLPEILAVPGFASAQRFVVSPVVRGPAMPPSRHSHLAVYEITGDPRLAFEALACAREAGAVSRCGAIADLAAHLFEPITARLLAPPREPA
jgi:hypothetical protein